MKKICIIFLSTSLAAIFSSFSVFSQQEPITRPDEEWDPPSAGTLTTWTAPLCGKNTFVVQPFFYYNFTRGSFNTEAHYDSLPQKDEKYQYVEQVLFQYGITDKFEIDLQPVYEQNYVTQDTISAHSHGWADSSLFGRYCFLEEKGLLPHITGIVQVKFPTGKYQKLDPAKLETDSMGTGSYDHGYGLIMTKKFKPFKFHLDAIYSFPEEVKIDGVNTKYARYLNYDLGMEYFFGKGFNLMLELNGVSQGDKLTNGEFNPASDNRYLMSGLGIGWSFDKVQTLLSYQRILTGTNTDANDSVVLTMVYTF